MTVIWVTPVFRKYRYLIIYKFKGGYPMAFSSIEFIFIFLPGFLLVFYLAPIRLKPYCLLLGSLLFYWLSVKNIAAFLLPVFGILLAYFSGLACRNDHSKAKLFSTVSLSLMFALLLGFKYAGLFSKTPIIVPAGMSFYTFQLTAYIFDVRRQKYKAEKNPLKLATGMMMFPKLLSGPITPYEDLRPHILNFKCTYDNFDSGLRTFIIGLGMKVLIADRVGGLWTQVQSMGFDGISTPFAWLGILAYSLQLYFDFSGYSVMAVGIGKMLGLELPQNFNYPYISRSMSDFWRRWHITLGKWFREYVYIPLGGNRVGRKRQMLNLFIVWMLTGIWHGATFNFILWGLFLFIIIALEKILKIDRNNAPISHLYMIPAILISWTFFAITDVKALFTFFGKLFPFFGSSEAVLQTDYIYHGKQYIVYIIVGILASTPLIKKLWDRINKTPLGTIVLFIIFWLSIFCLSVGLNDPFMYFNF